MPEPSLWRGLVLQKGQLHVARRTVLDWVAWKYVLATLHLCAVQRQRPDRLRLIIAHFKWGATLRALVNGELRSLWRGSAVAGRPGCGSGSSRKPRLGPGRSSPRLGPGRNTPDGRGRNPDSVGGSLQLH